MVSSYDYHCITNDPKYREKNNSILVAVLNFVGQDPAEGFFHFIRLAGIIQWDSIGGWSCPECSKGCTPYLAGWKDNCGAGSAPAISILASPHCSGGSGRPGQGVAWNGHEPLHWSNHPWASFKGVEMGPSPYGRNAKWQIIAGCPFTTLAQMIDF